MCSIPSSQLSQGKNVLWATTSAQNDSISAKCPKDTRYYTLELSVRQQSAHPNKLAAARTSGYEDDSGKRNGRHLLARRLLRHVGGPLRQIPKIYLHA